VPKGDKELNDRVRAMQPGDKMEFPLPMEQPTRRLAYQAVNSRANRLFGRGNYSLAAEFHSPRCWLWR